MSSSLQTIGGAAVSNPAERKLHVIPEPSAGFSSADAPTALIGESPAVDQAAGLIWWVDTPGKRLYRTTLHSGDTQSWEMPEEAGFVVLDEAGLPAIGMETGIFAFNPETASLRKLLAQERSGHRFNDATVDADGVLWVSTMALDLTRDAGAIWRVGDDLTLEPIIRKLSIPNGMAVDTARGRLYYSDSHPDVQTIWTAPIDPGSGEVGSPVVFADMKNHAGRPDGAALDEAGRYWIAAVDGAALHVYSPEAELLFEVPLPVDKPTKPAFFGARRDRLAVTSKSGGDHGGRLTLLSFDREFVRGTLAPRWKHATKVRTSPV